MDPVQGVLKMDKYAWVCRISVGCSAIIHKMQDRRTQELVAVKFIKRGDMVLKHVEEIVNHRSLVHPHIVRFKEITATPSHLGIVMEFVHRAPPKLLSQMRLPVSEDMARILFQQLISGVSYSHSQVVCHRDLKPHHFLIGTARVDAQNCVEIPHLKICDFSSSITSFLRPDDPSRLAGTAAYMAPEVWQSQSHFDNYCDDYDGRSADVWSCGVVLYRMLVGCYPFGSPTDENPIESIIKCVSEADYEIPDHVHISSNSRDLLHRILVADPALRLTIPEIAQHSWFRKQILQNLEQHQIYVFRDPSPPQSTEEMLRIIDECKTVPRTRHSSATSLSYR